MSLRGGGGGGLTDDSVAPVNFKREVELTDGATINTDLGLGSSFRVTLGGNRTIADPTNMVSGVIISYRIIQDGTGGRTVTWGSAFSFKEGETPTLSTGASEEDLLRFYCDGTNMIRIADGIEF